MADARVVRARHWIEFVRLLKDTATQDLDQFREEIEDAARDAQTTTEAGRKGLAQGRIARARERLGQAYKRRAAIRELLLLDDEDADGES